MSNIGFNRCEMKKRFDLMVIRVDECEVSIEKIILLRSEKGRTILG